MITVEEKINMFRKLVYKDEEEKLINEIKLINDKNDAIIEDKKAELKKKKNKLIEKERLNAKIQYNEMKSREAQENNGILLTKRQEMLSDLIYSLKLKAKEFCKSSMYKDYLLDKLSNVIKDLNDKELIITLSVADKEIFERNILELANNNNKDIIIETIENSDMIGGFILSDKDRTYNYDNSIRSIIEENNYEIGKKLFLALEDTGELNG